MLAVGITGGIGSGKTTTCRIFEVLGIPVYYADIRAQELMVQSPQLVAQIKELLGAEAYLPDGRLNRKYVGTQIFADEAKRLALNGLVHPAVGADARAWQTKQTDAPYSLQEAALLYESGGDKRVDKMIVVTAPEDLRIERVIQRDGLKADEVRARMSRQLPDVEKVSRADYVIYNDGEQSLVTQVLAIHTQLKTRASYA